MHCQAGFLKIFTHFLHLCCINVRIISISINYQHSFSSSSSSSLGKSSAPPPPPDAPSIIAEMMGGAVHLRCSFAATSTGSGSSLGHVVSWSRLSGPEGRREELKQETTVQTSALIELDGFNLRLGDKVGSWSIEMGVYGSLLNSQANNSTLKSL